MKPSDCQHDWVKEPGKVTKVCLWCGIPQVRTSAPRPVMKCPPRSREPWWQDAKSRHGRGSRR